MFITARGIKPSKSAVIVIVEVPSAEISNSLLWALIIFNVLLFYKVLTSGSSLMNKYADHAFNGILKVSFTIVGDSMSLYVILIGVTLDVFPVAYILERPFWSTIRIPAKCPLDDNAFTSSFVVESPE